MLSAQDRTLFFNMLEDLRARFPESYRKQIARQDIKIPEDVGDFISKDQFLALLDFYLKENARKNFNDMHISDNPRLQSI